MRLYVDLHSYAIDALSLPRLEAGVTLTLCPMTRLSRYIAPLAAAALLLPPVIFAQQTTT